ncbi:hypothetical protein HHX47_DHR10000219, partial [Lentinula edodes]
SALFVLGCLPHPFQHLLSSTVTTYSIYSDVGSGGIQRACFGRSATRMVRSELRRRILDRQSERMERRLMTDHTTAGHQ